MTVISNLYDWKLQAASSLYDSAYSAPCRAISTDPSSFSVCRNTTALPAVVHQLISQLQSFLMAAWGCCHGHCCSTNSSRQAISWHQAVPLHSCPAGLHTPVTGLNSQPTLHPWSFRTPTVTILSWHNEESLFTKHSQKTASCYSFSELCCDDIPLGFCLILIQLWKNMEIWRQKNIS